LRQGIDRQMNHTKMPLPLLIPPLLWLILLPL
jgi:hypothetical protein